MVYRLSWRLGIPQLLPQQQAGAYVRRAAALVAEVLVLANVAMFAWRDLGGGGPPPHAPRPERLSPAQAHLGGLTPS